MELRYPYLTSLSNEFVISYILCWPWVLLEMPSVTDCVNFHPSSIAVPLIGSRYDENKSCVKPTLLRSHLNSLGSTISKLKKKNLKSFQGFLVSLFCVIFPYHVKVTMLLKKKELLVFFLKLNMNFMTVLVLARGCSGSCGQSFPGRCRAGWWGALGLYGHL